jgi:hypothetical protein
MHKFQMSCENWATKKKRHKKYDTSTGNICVGVYWNGGSVLPDAFHHDQTTE